jgi:hypothetical protein
VIEIGSLENQDIGCASQSNPSRDRKKPEGHKLGRQKPDAQPGHEVLDYGALPFLIRRDGAWLYKGTPINRKAMVCLFSSVLKRDADGQFLLETPAERGSIEVEDAPFVAVEMDWTGHGREQVLTFRTSVDQVVSAGRAHRLRVARSPMTCEPTPYIHLRDGAGAFPIEARINRAVYYELVALAESGFVESRRVLGVWSDGVFFPLGDMPNE